MKSQKRLKKFEPLLNNLKIRLKNAVKNEKYEIAAEIRDKIKNIES